MCIAEVRSAKSATVASGRSRSFSLGMIGGSSQPMGNVFAPFRTHLRHDQKRRVRYGGHAVGSRVVREPQRRLALASSAEISDSLQPVVGLPQITEDLGRDACRVKDPLLQASNELPSTRKRAEVRRRVRFTFKEGSFRVRREREMAVFQGLGAGDEPPHAVDRFALLTDDEVRIAQSAAIEQVRRDHGMVPFERLPREVLVGKQAPVAWRVVGRVQPDDDHVHVRLAASVRTPGEGPK